MNDALKVLLPNLPDKDIPSGFEVIGDIAHMNLQSEVLIENRFKIGQVVLDKNTGLRVVVRKIG